nr:MAG TPA: hypothetical protein [Caudoviricetes sp.]
MAESFVFYGTWEEQLECVDPAIRGQFLEAIINYGLREEEPDFTGLARALWVGIKNDMDNAKARRIKNMENGKRGGIQKALNAGTKKEQSSSNKEQEQADDAQIKEPLASPSECLATPSDRLASPSHSYLDVDVDVDVDVDADVNAHSGTIAPQAPPKRRFVKPTVDEIRAYCAERKNNIDPQYFWDYYEARGWKAGGRSAMKDWRAAVRTWEKNNFQTSPPKNHGMDGDQSQQSKASEIVKSWKTGVYA